MFGAEAALERDLRLVWAWIYIFVNPQKGCTTTGAAAVPVLAGRITVAPQSIPAYPLLHTPPPDRPIRPLPQPLVLKLINKSVFRFESVVFLLFFSFSCSLRLANKQRASSPEAGEVLINVARCHTKIK